MPTTWFQHEAFHLVAVSHSVVSNSFMTPWAVARQAPLSMGFPRQEYWGGLPLPAPGDLPDPGIEPGSPILSGGFSSIWATREAPVCILAHSYFCQVQTWNSHMGSLSALLQPACQHPASSAHRWDRPIKSLLCSAGWSSQQSSARPCAAPWRVPPLGCQRAVFEKQEPLVRGSCRWTRRV